VKKTGKYDTSGLIEDIYEPGSRGRVLKNLLGIKGRREMDRVEAAEQIRALKELLTIYDKDHRFTAADICSIHSTWLGRIYEWAGKYRQVNISKGGFPFAAARQVPLLMDELEKGPLRMFTPCRSALQEDVVNALAEVHTELVLVHPFREGNGRVARLLAILMAAQAGLPPLDFGLIKGRKRDDYFAAIQSGMDRDYGPMKEIFSALVSRTISTRERR